MDQSLPLPPSSSKIGSRKSSCPSVPQPSLPFPIDSPPYPPHFLVCAVMGLYDGLVSLFRSCVLLATMHICRAQWTRALAEGEYRMLAESGFWQNADHFFGVFLQLWRPCNSHTTAHSLTGPLGQPFASRLGGQRFTSQECTHSHKGIGFSC
jgi:hypothetical protein